MNSTTVVKIACGTALLGGTGTGGIYLSTKEHFWEQVKHKCIPKDLKDNDIWKKAQDILEQLNDEEKLSKTFKEIRQKIKSAKDSDTKKTNGEYLREDCFGLYDQIFKSIFSPTTEDKLLENIKTYCSIKVKDVLGTDNLIATNSNDAVWKAAQDRFKAIKDKETIIDAFKEEWESVQADTSATKGDILKAKCTIIYEEIVQLQSIPRGVKQHCSYTIGDKLTPEKTFSNTGDTDPDMEAIKTKMGAINEGASAPFANFKNQQENKWKEYRTECQKLYVKQWKGDGDSDYTLAKSNCEKTTTPTVGA